MHAPSNYAQKSYIKPYTDSIIKMSKMGHFVFKYFLGGVAALLLTFDCRFEVLKSTQRVREGKFLLLRTPRTQKWLQSVCIEKLDHFKANGWTSASNVAACRRTRCYQQYLGEVQGKPGNTCQIPNIAQQWPSRGVWKLEALIRCSNLRGCCTTSDLGPYVDIFSPPKFPTT